MHLDIVLNLILIGSKFLSKVVRAIVIFIQENTGMKKLEFDISIQ